MTAWEIMDETLRSSGMWDAETNWRRGGQDSRARSRGRTSSTGSRRRTGNSISSRTGSGSAPRGEMPELPDHFDVIDNATDEKPFRLVAAPARTFLNSTFTETPSSLPRGAADGAPAP